MLITILTSIVLIQTRLTYELLEKPLLYADKNLENRMNIPIPIGRKHIAMKKMSQQCGSYFVE
jgi:hypothetical protein